MIYVYQNFYLFLNSISGHLGVICNSITYQIKIDGGYCLKTNEHLSPLVWRYLKAWKDEVWYIINYFAQTI